MKRLISIIFLLITTASYGQILRSETTFNDDKFPFSINYSSLWETVVPTLPVKRISLRYKSPSIYSEFNINVLNWPNLRNDSAENYVNSLLNDRSAILTIVRIIDPKAELLEAKQIVLDGRPATSILSRLELEIEGVRKNLFQHQFQTLVDGNVYTMTLFVEVRYYSSMILELEKFKASFKIREQVETFVDPIYSFSIVYPATWRKEVASTPNMRLKLRSGQGTGGADVSVIATAGTNAQGTTPNQVIEYVLKNPVEMIGPMKQSMPDIQLISVRETKVDGIRAIETIYKGSVRSSSNNLIGLKFHVISIPLADVMYTITSRSPVSDFDLNLPEFTKIVNGFKHTK